MTTLTGKEAKAIRLISRRYLWENIDSITFEQDQREEYYTVRLIKEESQADLSSGLLSQQPYKVDCTVHIIHGSPIELKRVRV